MLRLVAAGVFITSVLGLGSAQGQASVVPLDPATPITLDVPYLHQSILLCGGAALAMVERWWGRRGVYSEDFQDLVHPELGGIRTTDLSARSTARGWDTAILRGDREAVQLALQHGVPVIALIEVAPARYHYVVVIGWADHHVVYHDPASGPSLALGEERFTKQWQGADGWAMVVRPSSPIALTPERESAALPIDSLPCRPWLDQAIAATADNRFTAALELLDAAHAACPKEALVLRERGMVAFKQGNHQEVIRLLSDYLDAEADDALAWQLLGTSRYLNGDSHGALVAWGHLNRPVVDLVVVNGIERLRFPVIADAVALPQGTVLTTNNLALARRRVGEVPALDRTRVEYQPLPGGLAEVVVNVTVRPTVQPLWRVVGENVVRALAQRQIGIHVASPSGAGELWSATWRWDHARPRVSVGTEIPLRLGLPGILSIETVHERLRFAVDTARNSVVEQSHHLAAIRFGGWINPSLRPTLSLGLERWQGNAKGVTVGLATDVHTHGDHLLIRATSEYAAGLGNQKSYTRLGVRGMWASSLDLAHTAWSARLGVDWVSDHAPLGSWPLVSGGSPSTIPLRAHPLKGEDLIRGGNVGQRILHAGVSRDQPVHRFGPMIVAVGLFLDAADIARAANGPSKRVTYLDGGAGIRLGVAGGSLGVVRIDVARSLLVDRRHALSVGIHLNWPFFQ